MSGDPLAPENLSNRFVRNIVFRELGREFMLEIVDGKALDPPGLLARMMERVFKAGQECDSIPTDRVDDEARPEMQTHRETARHRRVLPRLTEDDLPAMPKRALSHFRRAVGVDKFSNRMKPAQSEGIVLIMRPKVPGLPPTQTRDQWFYVYSGGEVCWGNPTIEPLITLGLYEDARGLPGGWKVTYMTEWGYEFFSTGETAALKDRVPGQSSTYNEFQQIAQGDRRDLFFSVGKRAGIIKDVAPKSDNEVTRGGMRP